MMLVIGFSKWICLSVIYVLLVLFSIEFSCANANALSSACCTECNCNVTESGDCSLQYRGDCNNETCINFNFLNKTSVIEVEISTQYQQITKFSTESTSAISAVEAIKLDIYEFNTETKEYMMLETRSLHIDESNSRNENYLTRTSDARICVSLATNWSLYEVKFSVKERKYTRLKPEVEDPLNATGEILGQYVPNSVSLYKLPEHPTIKWKGIEIAIQDLKIDSENGEYLLIGAGSPDDYPPRFISKITDYSLFYIANASAYIEFRSIFRRADTFKIMWKRIDAEKPVPINLVDALNAILVCFHNYTEAKKEFVGDTKFPAFRKAFAESVRKNTKKFDCTKSSVDFIEHPRHFKTSDALSVFVTLRCEGKLIKYQELQNLMAIFTQEDLNKTLGYKVELCESPSNHMSGVGMWTILLYVLVASLGLFIWAWKNNIFNQKCSPEKEKPTFDLEINSFPAEQNTYETTIPKICLEDGYGRRQTLVPGSPQDEEEEEGTEATENVTVTEVEMNAIPSTSKESDTLLQVLANRRSKRRPSIQSLISKKDENVSNENCNVPESEGDESEHLYDSVSSSKGIKETKL